MSHIRRLIPTPKVLHDKDLIKKWKIVRGDQIEVIAGKDKKKRGMVLKCYHKENRLIIQGINIVKKAMKGTEYTKGSFIYKEAPIHYSNVALIDPITNLRTKVKLEFTDTGEKIRKSRKFKDANGNYHVVAKPIEYLTSYKKERADQKVGENDTPPDLVLLKTFQENSLIPKIRAAVLKKITSSH